MPRHSPHIWQPGQPTFDRSVEKTAGLHAHFHPNDRIDQVLFVGMIVQPFQYAHAYLVQTDLGPTLPATALGSNSHAPHGYRDHGMYLPGTKVLCFCPPSASSAIILGAVNAEDDWDKVNLADAVLWGGRSSFKDNAVHNYIPTRTKPAGTVRNHNAHRPIDSLPGEWGKFNVLGMGLHLGTLSVQMRNSEVNGLWMFRNNELQRQAAYNYQLWTAGRELTAVNDESEYDEVDLRTPYPWEAGGVLDLGQKIARDGATEWQRDGQDALYEPKLPDQLGIFRDQRYGGYLGDLRRVLTAVLPQKEDKVTADSPEALSKKTRYLGLYERVEHVNGMLVNRSAKAIFSIKEVAIPVPKKVANYDDPEGDSQDAENYKFAGRSGGGEAHRKHEFKAGGKDSAAGRMAAFNDLHAWAVNSYGQAGFHYHEKDWYYPQESELFDVLDHPWAIDPAVYQPMGLKAFSPPAAYTSVKIDHRPGHMHRLYHTKSVIAQLDDGSVLIRGGKGEELKTVDGNWVLTCPGDVYLQPGRNLVGMAPRDIMLRAGYNFESTAAKGDWRAKSEWNMHLLAGNSGETGGLLLETRSGGFTHAYAGKVGVDVTSSGVVVMARKSQFLAYSKETYLRTLPGGTGITLDADRGNANLYSFHSQCFETTRSSRITAYGVGPDQDQRPRQVEVHSGSSVFFGQDGEILSTVRATFYPRNTYSLYNGQLVSSVLRADSVPQAPWGPGDRKALSQATRRTQVYLRQVQTTGSAVRKMAFGKNRPGNEAFVAQVGFSLRSDEQYGITEFTMHEHGWQQWHREAGTNTKVWEEPVVKSPDGKETMPWPGFDTWKNQPVFMTVDSKFWSAKDGRFEDRRYDDPTGNEPKPTTMATGYLITAQVS